MPTPTINFVSPTEWGARKRYDTWADTPYVKDNIAIHWGGNEQVTWKDGIEAEKAILKAWEDYHIDVKGWRGIAYGYAIGASGTVYRLRGKNNYGAHSGDYDLDGVSNNKEIIPVVFIMGENSGPPTEAMWHSMSKLFYWLTDQTWTATSLEVFGHRDIQPTPTRCPGDAIVAGIRSGRATDTSVIFLPDVELATWAKPGDPIDSPEDVVAVRRHLGLNNLPPEWREAWMMDALMRHDIRLNELEGG